MANFGFFSKYQQGANAPTGNTHFNFRVGNLSFDSDSYDWLVVNQGGDNAKFKGSGTINSEMAPGGVPYKFLIWATDGAPDTFRIKIWYEDENGEEIGIYDNGTAQPIGPATLTFSSHRNPVSLELLWLLAAALTPLWGNYHRAQGLVTQLTYLLLFLVVSSRLRPLPQLQRLTTAMVATGIPIVLLGLAQRLGGILCPSPPTMRRSSTPHWGAPTSSVALRPVEALI